MARSAHLVRDGPGMSAGTLPVVLRVPRADRVSALRYFARRNPRMILGGALVFIWLFLAAFAPLVAPYDPIKVNVADSLLPPSGAHFLGTDDLGRDVLSRVIWGSRVSLSVGVISVSIGFLLGVSLGLAAGYLGGTFDLLARRRSRRRSRPLPGRPSPSSASAPSRPIRRGVRTSTPPSAPSRPSSGG